MSTERFKISDAELEVMRILWREEQAVSFSDIRTELSGKWAGRSLPSQHF